ncbi:MAG TPA: hypothetical protein VKA89_00655 [Solirubrobacterales bacterium]|nr:hypothetical protein [Solirubrobacterales bacterium]
MKRRRNKAERLRTAVAVLPRHTREAMLRGIDGNTIIVGAYTDRDGGVCPMLAAHRNGGRTSFASFARAWDDFTSATKRPRPASRREVAVLRSYLEMSLLADDAPQESLTEIAGRIRSERRAAPPVPEPDPPTGRRERIRITDLRGRRPRPRRGRPVDLYEATLAASADRRD